MEASMAASSRGAMPSYSSLRGNKTAGMANSRSNPRRVSLHSAFCETSQMQYYAGTVKIRCGGKKDKLDKERLKGLGALYDGSLSEKRRIKLLELVSKDLSALSTTFVEGVDAQKSLAEEVRGQIFSDALQVLTAQLEQVKAEHKQRKKEKKAQKKAQKKLQTNMHDDATSSSASSDSECEAANMVQPRMNSTTESPPKMAEEMEGVKRVQVCMGGKCRKAGSEQLLALFNESIRESGMGCRAEAVGCKCMGSCRSAPNVKVQSENGREILMAVETGNVDAILHQMEAGSLVPL